MKVKISDVFDINQGHQITDEEIYNSSGNIPIYTSSNIIKGYGNNSLVNTNDLPCITYQTKGFSGILTVQHNMFDANNTAVLIIKDEYKKIIDLNYVILQLKNKFLDILTAESGVSYLNKEIVSIQEIEFPVSKDNCIDIDIQKKVVKEFEKLINLKSKIEVMLEKVKSKATFELDVLNCDVKTVEQIALLNKGSNQISEEAIYKNYDKDGYPVYSSATKNEGLMGRVKKEYFDNFHKKGNAGELTWTTNGYAGLVFYRDTDYLYSEKCGRIVIREEYKDLINPKYLMLYLNQITYKYKTAESNNGKLDIIHMSNIPVKLPLDDEGNISISIQNAIIDEYSKLWEIESKLNEVNEKIEKFIN